MTRFRHDQFAKQYLEELLTPLGEVNLGLEVPGESRQVDVWFAPSPQSGTNPQQLGLLGRFAVTSCLLEPFRNQPTPTEVRSCLLKLFLVHADVQRKAKRSQERLQEDELAQLWILASSASDNLLNGFGASLDQNEELQGVYFLSPALRAAIVAINQLPATQETLWLRILGRGATQEQAIRELIALPREHPFRRNALELLFNWRLNLEQSDDLDEEDREVFMNLSPAYLQRREEILQEGVQQGVRQGQRVIIENFLKVRFGSLDEQLSTIVEPLLELPPEEFTRLLAQLSRDELLARFEHR